MQDVNVVVVFCGDESAERLAQAAAVGAVQGRANIRLRRLAETDPRQAQPQDYIAPRSADAEWADAIIACMPVQTDSLAREGPIAAHDATVQSPGRQPQSRLRFAGDYCFAGDYLGAAVFEQYFDSLKTLREAGKLKCNVGGLIASEDEAALRQAMESAGLTLVPATPDPRSLTGARLLGRSVADSARALRG
jgi:hypothetical protein